MLAIVPYMGNRRYTHQLDQISVTVTYHLILLLNLIIVHRS